MKTKPEKSLQQKYDNFSKSLQLNSKAIQLSLPRGIKVERIMRIVLTEVRNRLDLLDCNQSSIISSVLQASQLGLEVGSTLGHAYLVPYNSKKGKICQFILGYRGMIQLISRIDLIVDLKPIYENDIFEIEYGLNQNLRHIPTFDDPGKFIGAYAIAFFKDGRKLFDVMSKQSIDKVRSRSKSGNSEYSPWNTDYQEMAMKTVCKHLFKRLPISIELQKALAKDDIREIGIEDNTLFENEETEEIEIKNNTPIDNLIEDIQSNNQNSLSSHLK